MNDANTKRFFITGVSTGFGRALGMAALEEGHRRRQLAVDVFDRLQLNAAPRREAQ